MTNLENYEVQLKDHAYMRYCERVGIIDREILRQWCQKQLQIRRFSYRKKMRLIEFSRTYWICELTTDRHLLLTTCLGRGDFDMVHALLWAEKNNDRINLKDMMQLLRS
jgi:hypothetical protein